MARAQVFTIDAGVRSPELPSIRERLQVRQFANVAEATAITEATWSPDVRFETHLEVPVVARDIDALPASPGAHGTVAGLGDLLLRGKLALLRQDDVMVSDRIAALGTLHLPTGSHDEKLDGQPVPRRLQPGLGVFGFGIGVAGTIVRDRHRASLVAQWTHRGIHHGFAPGDEIAVDAAWWYRLTPAAFDPTRSESEIRSVVELRAVHQLDDAQNGASLDDGGLRLDGVVGLQVNTTTNQRFEIGATLPLHDDTKGAAGRGRLGIVLGLTLYF